MLGRKIFDKKAKLAPIKDRCKDLRSFAWSHMFSGDSDQIKKHARALFWKGIEWELNVYRIGMMAKTDKNAVGSASVDFLMYSGYVTLAEHWLRMEIAATKNLNAGKGDKEFYDAKIKVK